jgi:hypothetical protein
MKIQKFNSFNEKKDVKNYMFFSNLENMKKNIDMLLSMDKSKIDDMLTEHDWASDHISVANENLDHVFNFLSNAKTNEQKEEINIQEWFEKKFPNKDVYESDSPIKNNIHCVDYDVNGILVRGRWYSPTNKGDKSCVKWHIVTDEQKEEIARINKQVSDKKIADKKRDDELRKWRQERLHRS